MNEEKKVLFDEMMNCVYTIRGEKVILERDLAYLFNVETDDIRQAINKNSSRFPKDFCFQLTVEEVKSLNSKVCTEKVVLKKGDIRNIPFAFTIEGIAMLSGILESEAAVEVSVRIMRLIAQMRHFLTSS